MANNSKNRSRSNSKSTRKIRRTGRLKLSKVLSALIIEGLAVIAILTWCVGIRADVDRQARLETLWDRAEYGMQEIVQQAERIEELTEPVLESAKEQWAQWNLGFETVN